MADVVTNVSVIPNVSLTSPPVNNSGTEALAVALLKSSENQAATTASLIAALAPQREPAMPSSRKQQSDQTMLYVVIGLVIFVFWK